MPVRIIFTTPPYNFDTARASLADGFSAYTFKFTGACCKISTTMKTIDRAILQELLHTFLLSVVALNFIMMTEQILRLTQTLSSVGAGAWDFMRIIILIQPQITVLTIPMALLISILLCFGRLNGDSELVVLKASGMPFRRIACASFILGVAAFIFSIALSTTLGPACVRELRLSVHDIFARRAPYAIESGIFHTGFGGIVIHVKDKPAPDTLKGIFIHDSRRKGDPVVLYAKTGLINASGGEGGLTLDLYDGQIEISKEGRATEIAFGSYSLALNAITEGPSERYTEANTKDLLDIADTVKGKDRRRALLEFWRRLTMPAVCLILMVLGPPLSLRAGKTGRLGGLVLGIAVFAAYYASLMYAENLALAGKVQIWLGAWGPAIILGALSLWIFKKADSV